MNRIKAFIVFMGVFFCSTFYAQNEEDVLRYSTTDVFGTARFEAMAGSFGGIGADFSAIQVNPASLGRFSSSRVTVSVNNSVLQNNVLYNETNTSSMRNKFVLSNLGVVISNDLSRNNRGRRFGQITLGYTRLKNFNNTIRYKGQNFYSLLDVFASDGFGIDPAYIYDARPFTTGLAYDVYALDYNGETGVYYSRLTMGDMYHNRTIKTDGGMGEYHIGYSENFKNKLYYGASIGIRQVKYIEHVEHNERLLDTVGTTLRSFDYLYDQTSKGWGVNLKLGVIYLPIEQLRLGLAFETPTVLGMKDVWSADMTATHNDGVKYIEPVYVPVGQFNYRVKTPMKLRGSFAYVFAMRGAINVDLEMSRLPGGKLKTSSKALDGSDTDPNFFGIENAEVKNQFRTILNTRIGVEYMLFRDFFLRGGVAILPQPYKKDIGNIKTPNMTYATGFGWENRFLSVDLSYRLLQLHSDYYAFDPSQIENRAEMRTNVHNIVLSMNYKF